MELLCIDDFCFKCGGYIWKHSWWSNDETAYWEFQISFICLETIKLGFWCFCDQHDCFDFLNIPGLLTWKKTFQFMKNIVYARCYFHNYQRSATLCINLRSIYFNCVVDISSNNIEQTKKDWGVSSIAIIWNLLGWRSCLRVLFFFNLLRDL